MKQSHKIEIANKHRIALRQFMEENNLNVLSWSNKANLRESTLRNFLNGDSASITSKTLHELAQAANTNISQILGETSCIDPELLKEVLIAVAEEEGVQGLSLDIDSRSDSICHLYEIAILDSLADIKKETASLLRFIKHASIPKEAK